MQAPYFPQTQHHHLAAEIYQRYISSSTSVVKIDKSIARRMEAFMLGNSVGYLSIEPGSEKTCLQVFATSSDTNQAGQPQKMARGLKFWIYRESAIGSTFSLELGSEQVQFLLLTPSSFTICQLLMKG